MQFILNSPHFSNNRNKALALNRIIFENLNDVIPCREVWASFGAEHAVEN